MTEREIAALKCAQHIIKIKRTHSDYRDSWVGGESNLATEYMLLRQRVQAAEAALADARRENDAMKAVVEAAEETMHWNEQTALAVARNMHSAIDKAGSEYMVAFSALDEALRAHRARAKEGA